MCQKCVVCGAKFKTSNNSQVKICIFLMKIQTDQIMSETEEYVQKIRGETPCLAFFVLPNRNYFIYIYIYLSWV